MDSRDAIRPILAGLIGIGLVVLVIVLIIKGFTGTNSGPTNQIDITKYANTPNSSVILLVDAPTSLDQAHRQVRITVSGISNQIDIIQGYQDNVVASQSYPNNSAAYATFLQTLKLMDFSRGKQATTDYRGYCPTGDRYILTFNNGETDAFSYWATSCGGQGTYEGKLSPVLAQFQRQIPSQDFDQMTNNIPLNF